MKHILFCLLVGLLFVGCTPSSRSEHSGASDSTITEKATDSVQVPADVIASAAIPKNFQEFIDRYYTAKPPFGKWKDDLNGTWAPFPEERFSPEVMKKFLYGTPAFPKFGDDVRFLPYQKIDIDGTHWLLLTYESSYGNTLIASVFDLNGKVEDGMKIYRDPEDEYEGEKYFFYDENKVLNIFTQRPKDASGETDQGYLRDTLRYQISEGGKFVEL